MIKDELFYNVNTGEVLAGTAAIKQYAAEHPDDVFGDWTSEWKPTGKEADNFISAPDFTKAINI